MPGHLHILSSEQPSPGRAAISLDHGFDLIARLGPPEHWMAVLVTLRAAGARQEDAPDPSVSIVISGILPHPVTREPVIAFVSRGGTARLKNLRRRPRATLVFRSGWEWVSASGPVELAGPDDPLPGLPSEAVPGLLRDIFHAAGGIHDDLEVYDEVMAREHRTAVLLRPERFTTNPPGAEHIERRA